MTSAPSAKASPLRDILLRIITVFGLVLTFLSLVSLLTFIAH